MKNRETIEFSLRPAFRKIRCFPAKISIFLCFELLVKTSKAIFTDDLGDNILIHVKILSKFLFAICKMESCRGTT